jgi:hypothetical protein
LDRGADDVAEKEEQHAELPSSPAVRGAAGEVLVLFVLEHVRLALQGKTDGLDACRYEADDDSQLEWRVRQVVRVPCMSSDATYAKSGTGRQ